VTLELGLPYEFRGYETLINIDTSWWLTNYFLMIRLAKVQYGVKYIPFIHDLIPIITPEHCTKELTQDFVSWITGVFFHADGYLVNSHSTAADLKKVAGLLGHSINEPRVVRLDGSFHAPSSNRSVEKSSASAHADIPNGPFVLFVGTIESRKNHLLAFDVWLELIRKRGDRGTPTLVCVGNEGWMVEAAMSRLSASDQLRRRVRVIQRVSDGELTRLYRDCLFTIYPSAYEGWGLPVTEALSFGKMVVTTAVSSLPEVGGDLVDYFDLLSPADMLAKVERLIDDADYRRAREAKISAGFQVRSWLAIGEEIVDHAIALSEQHQLSDIGQLELDFAAARASGALLFAGAEPANQHLARNGWRRDVPDGFGLARTGKSLRLDQARAGSAGVPPAAAGGRLGCVSRLARSPRRRRAIPRAAARGRRQRPQR
jgi:glycosyltransferase involved in cell wall biosynthesis